MKIIRKNREMKVISRMTKGLLFAFLMLGFGFTGLQAQNVQPANFYNLLNGEATNEITLDPGDTFTWTVGINSTGGMDGVTITYDFPFELMQEDDELAVDLIPAFIFPVQNEVENETGYVSFTKTAVGTFITGTQDVAQWTYTIGDDVALGTVINIDHVTDPAVVLMSNIVYIGNEILDPEDAPGITIFIGEPVVFDCPELEANIGDACNDDNDDTENDIVTEDCECEGTTVVVFDCPELEANIGDACDDDNDDTENDIVTEDCECEGTTVIVFDCPELEANIGDACDDDNDDTENDVVGDDCVCMGTTIPTCDADAGAIVFADSSTSVTVCVDDQDPSTVDVDFSELPTDSDDLAGTWVVTDADGNLLGLPSSMEDVENIDFDNAGAGNCLIWFLSFDPENSNVADLAASFGDGLDVNASELEGCFMLSNALEVVRENCGGEFDCPELEANIGDACDDDNDDTENDVVGDDCVCMGTTIPTCDADAGAIVFADSSTSVTVCVDDQDPSTVDVDFSELPTDSDDLAGTWVVTDADGNLLGLPSSMEDVENINFDNAGAGNCLIWFLSFDPENSNVADLAASFGDGLDVNASELEGCFMLSNALEVVRENCGSEFDCPELEANIGDACDLAEGENGTINENCECVPAPDCENFMYYLSDHSAADGISDIYGVTLSGGVATMSYIATSETEVHIAFNEEDNNIYALSKFDNSYRVLDPSTGVFGPTVMLGGEYGEITAAVFNAEGKLVFGSQDNNAIYCVNVTTNVVTEYDSFAPVTGGDLAFGSDGMLYLATRSGGGGLYEVYPDDVMADVLIGSVANPVTGMAITDGDQLLVSTQGMMSLELYNTDGSSAMTSFMLDLDGEPYTLRDGDMASGCNTGDIVTSDCDNYATFYVNHGPDVDGSDLYSVDFIDGNAELNYITNVDFEAHIGYNPEEGLMYFVNKDGSIIRVYNVVTDAFEGDVAIVGGVVDQLTAVLYDSNDGELYVGDADSDVISSIDLNTGIPAFYANAPVFGGDISILNGTMYLARRNLNELYEVVPFGEAILIGSIPGGVNGMAPSPNPGNLVTSSASQNAFVEISATDGSTVTTWPATLDGSAFTFINGDMASGCIDNLPQLSFNFVETESVLSAYPNPTSGLSQVVFMTAQTGRTLVEVYDMNGRNVKTLFNQEAQKDQEYRLDFNGSYLPNGVYIYRLTTNNETIVEKFMIAK